MNIIYDNIIFKLQRYGGISLLWKELIYRILKNRNIKFKIIEFKGSKKNIFRNELNIEDNFSLNNYLFINKYFDVKVNTMQKVIFHSSYYRLAKGKNVINVTTVHDFTYERFFKGFSRLVHSWQKKRAILKSDGIICISESTKRDLLCFIPQINLNKVKVIYNGVNDNFKKIDINSPFDKKHNFQDFDYSIYIGDHKTKYKNFETAIKACNLQKMKLLIIGGGEFTKNEIYLLNSLLGKSNYKLLLEVSTEDLNQYYNRAYCLIYPSLYEGFGIPILEAQKAGCPVIATNSSSIPEVIADLAFTLDSPTPEKIAQKMHLLEIGSDLRTKTIELGKKKAASFNWDKTYKETLEFYNELYKL